MPIFSYFYSATEEEAATRLRQHFPQPSEEAVSFSNRNAEQLELLLNGTTVSKPRPRNEFNQPLFHPKRAKPIGQLFNACTFGVTHKNVYRDKLVPFGSTSDDPQEWQTRSRTPSSDEPSPQKYCLPSPTPSVKVEASSNSDCSEDGLTHMFEPLHQRHMRSWTSYPGYNATYPQAVLQTMDTQFSKWSYDLNEGSTAFPFVMAQAPTETHERLVGIDRKLWDIGAESYAADVTDDQATTSILLKGIRKNASKGTRAEKVTGVVRHGSSDLSSYPLKTDVTSKRAALIAKSKATKDGSLVATKSVGQKRSALHKNKNRRSIMPSPPPTARKPEPTENPDSQAEKTKPRFLIYDSQDHKQRRSVDSALQNRSINFEDSHTLESLMEHLGKAKAAPSTGGSLEDVKETNLKEDGAEQTGRQKGKARRKAKSNAAR